MIFLFWHLRNFVVAKWISAEQHYGSFFSSILIILLRQVMQDTQHPLLGKGCLQHIFHNLGCSLLAGIASLDCFQDCFSPGSRCRNEVDVASCVAFFPWARRRGAMMHRLPLLPASFFHSTLARNWSSTRRRANPRHVR
uniref:Putative secreted protein n=1 Tax=Ixodes ricinus TaxID=34613 RepID=A0A6B0USX7_IXORI